MKKIILSVLACLIASLTIAQQNIKFKVVDKDTNLPLPGATASLKGKVEKVKSDENGIFIFDAVPNGSQTLIVKLIGYEEKEQTYVFPLAEPQVTIYLVPVTDDLETVTISSTRSSRNIQNIPTRVEFIAGEELEEKANMKPGDIRMVLSESTGIQTQQTSATSANAAIRIQGLDGRYTQLLRDGFPLYSGASSGLGLLQTAPLDLKQIEVIKGSASTLYGGGAIAGLVNLISKTPKIDRELNFHLDGTDAMGLSLNGFYGKRNERIGTTVFVGYQRNSAYDPAGIDLSAIPRSEKLTFNPKLFLYPSGKTTVNIGLNATIEDRTGGDMHYIRSGPNANHSYFEENNTQRVTAQASLSHVIDEMSHVTVKSSVSIFNRELSTPGYVFNGKQLASFNEFNYANQTPKREWIFGANVITDQFKEGAQVSISPRDYRELTIGAFAQNLWKLSDRLHFETGLRADYIQDYGIAILPRFSLLLKFNEKLSSRLGGGLGYKAPTIFTEESERLQFKQVLPISDQINRLEKSFGANWDLNYATLLANGDVSLTINHLFFFTQLKHPLKLIGNANSSYQFINTSGFLESKGTETNLKLGYEDFKLFLGYTYTDAHQHQNGLKTANPLTAKHRINAVLMYELEDKWKVGAEAYTFSKQLLTDGGVGKNYVITGLMAEKIWKRISIYINFENFLDTRQTKFDTIYTGTLNSPEFRDIYAPLDGFVINAGLKLKL